MGVVLDINRVAAVIQAVVKDDDIIWGERMCRHSLRLES